MSLRDEAMRGEHAADVLANPVYIDAYGQLEQEIINKWRESSDSAERERLHLMLKMLAKVRQVMQGVMTSGKVSAKELELQQTRMERLGNALRRR